jgi:hypothetical protein
MGGRVEVSVLNHVPVLQILPCHPFLLPHRGPAAATMGRRVEVSVLRHVQVLTAVIMVGRPLVAAVTVRVGGAVAAAVVVQEGRCGWGAVAARGGRSADPRVARQVLYRRREAVLRVSHGSSTGGR